MSYSVMLKKKRVVPVKHLNWRLKHEQNGRLILSPSKSSPIS